MTTRAKACVGYWAAHYINRDRGWSVACDALDRIIRCKTEKLALSVARYRRRRLQPLRGGSANPANTECGKARRFAPVAVNLSTMTASPRGPVLL
jgi:hypothetical protein